jgi:hypothetical protein
VDRNLRRLAVMMPSPAAIGCWVALLTWRTTPSAPVISTLLDGPVITRPEPQGGVAFPLEAEGDDEDLFDAQQLPRIGIAPVTDDAARLYETWVGMGGEGIVLKDRASILPLASVAKA